MKTEWDYSSLADAYLKRPDYSAQALEEIFSICGVKKGQDVCDIGAGVAHLTLHLANMGLNVVAVEPNDNMRANGMKRTAEMPNVSWVEANSHETKQEDGAFDFVTFGSSFNVADRGLAMQETYRILKPDCWFACMWNHRNLDDEIQNQIENIIKSHVDGYGYGSRREDQSEVIKNSEIFTDVQYIEGPIEHQMTIKDCVEAWRSHGTVQRQAGDKFNSVINEIENYLQSLSVSSIMVPYTTRAWIAKRK